MLALAARRNVQIRFVAQDSRSLHWIIPGVLRELLQTVESFLINQESLLDPALETAGRAHTDKAFLTIQNLDPLSVLHIADAVVNSRDLIAQRRLRSRNISRFQPAVTSPAAGRNHRHCRSEDECHAPTPKAQ